MNTVIHVHTNPPPPENRERIEFYTRERRVEFGKFLFDEIQRIQQQKGKDNVNAESNLL